MEPSTRGLDPCREHTILKRWYWNASAQAPNPSWTDMEKVRGDFHTLYQREEPHPPGLHLAIHVDPAKAKDDIPLEAEVEAAVRRLRQHRAGGHTQLCVEHFKQWRKESYTRE